MTIRTRLAALLLVFLTLAVPAAAERRVALVVGNGAYAALSGLVNPTADAGDVADQLDRLGFEVTLTLDADLEQMKAALVKFGAEIADADVALFYYAGHGLQVRQVNYLVPIDAELATAADVEARTVKLDLVLETIAKAGGIKLVFLDACQNNPLPEEEGGGADGLARIGTAANTLVTFATQPGMVAYDGAGRNSPFAEALLAHMPKRGLEVLPMLTSVNIDVNAATGGLQTPYVQFSVKPDFYFAPGEPEIDTPDLQLWRLAANGRDPSLLQIYLTRFPEGPHAGDARALLAEVGADAPTPAPVAAGAADDTAEETLWQLGRNARIHSLVDLYLARYPDGRHVDEARELLASLTPENDPNAPPPERCARLATHPSDATANVAGVSFAALEVQAAAAVEACTAAVAAKPEMAHYVALLARAEAAAGNREESLRLYREAAERGDARALVSLGLLTEAGDGVPKDLAAAAGYYERAAAAGFVDGMINHAVVLIEGTGVPKDREKGVALMRKAADTGAAIAIHNLGMLAESGVTGDPSEALALFERAAAQGYAGSSRAAAVLLDEGRTVPKDPEKAADHLLRGVATDSGELIGELTTKTASWSPATIKAVQARLQAAGYYTSTIDGRAGPKFAAALRQWRLLGPPSG